MEHVAGWIDLGSSDRLTFVSALAASVTFGVLFAVGVQGLVTVTATGPTNPPLNQNLVTVRINWLGSVKSETIVRRNKSVVLTTIIAPE